MDAGVFFDVGRNVFALGADTVVHRQPVVQRPRVLHEESDVAEVDRAKRPRHGDDVVAVSAGDLPVVQRRTRAPPVQVDGRELSPVVDVVRHALVLHARLDRVLSLPVAIQRRVGVDREPRVVVLDVPGARNEIGIAIRLLELGGDVGELRTSQVGAGERVPQAVPRRPLLVRAVSEESCCHVDVHPRRHDPVHHTRVQIVVTVASSSDQERGSDYRATCHPARWQAGPPRPSCAR